MCLNAPPMEAVILAVLFFVLAALGFGVLWFSRDQRGKRRLKNLESSAIADVQDGALVKITGKLSLGGLQQLDAPLTGRTCVGYVVEVKERKQSGANANWITIITKEDAVDFVVEDATGKALVKAAGSHLVLVRDGHLRSGALSDHSDRGQAFLLAQGTPSENILRMKKSLRYEEGVLEAGEEVSVLGIARWEAIPESMRREGDAADAKWLAFDTKDAHTLTISDDPSTL